MMEQRSKAKFVIVTSNIFGCTCVNKKVKIKNNMTAPEVMLLRTRIKKD